MKYCEMTIETFDFKARYFKCGRPAKYKSVGDSISNRSMLLCGIHRRSVDNYYKKTKSNKRCIPLVKKPTGESEN